MQKEDKQTSQLDAIPSVSLSFHSAGPFPFGLEVPILWLGHQSTWNVSFLSRDRVSTP